MNLVGVLDYVNGPEKEAELMFEVEESKKYQKIEFKESDGSEEEEKCGDGCNQEK